MELYAIKYAETTLPENCIFLGGDSSKLLPISFSIFLIKTDNRLILVDVGCDDMPGWDMRNFVRPSDVLKNMGIDTSDITDVVLTHSHYDHCAAIGHYNSARIYVNSAEYTQDLRQRIPKDAEVFVCDEETEIAEGVVLRCIGGHSEGSSVVELSVGDKIHVLCGDECYSPLCIENKTPTASSCNPHKSQMFIEKYSNPKYIVHICHNPQYLDLEKGYLKLL